MSRRATLPALLLALAAGPAAAAEVSLDAAAPAVAGARTALTLRVRDPATGWPLDGLALRAWLRPALGPEEKCGDAAGALARYGAGPRQALTLAGLRVLSLGEDATLGVIDPRLSLATANLARVDRLDAVPATAVVDAREAMLWASLPEQDRLLRLDLATGAPLPPLALSGGPRTLVADPAGGWLVGLDRAGAVAALAPDGSERARAVVGPGPVELALDRTGARVVALARAGRRLVLLDLPGLDAAGTVALDADADALAVVAAQDMAAIVTGDSLALVALDAPLLLRRLPLGIRPDRLLATGDGRWLFALDRARSILAVVDLARGQVRHALSFAEGAEELALGLDLLFVRLRDAPAVAVLALASLENTAPPALDRIIMGIAPTGGRDRVLMATAPGGRSLLLAHAADRRLYEFTGGAMRAPASAVPIKTAATLRLLLHAVQPQPLGGGRYRAVFQAPAPGAYSLITLLDQPSEAHCLPLAVGGEPAAEAATMTTAPRVTVMLRGTPAAGRPVEVALRVEEPSAAPLPPLRDLSLLAVRIGGSWRQRAVAASAGGADYLARLLFPAAGRYMILVEAPSAGIRYETGPRLHAEVPAEGPP